MPRRKPNTAPDSADPALSFEDAVAGLEQIVEAMEHGQLPLEELVAGYEQGSALLKHCEHILTAARGRIELITLRGQEAAADAPPEPAAEPPRPSAATAAEPAADADDDDIRLF